MSIRRHTAYNLFGAIVPLAVSLVTVPIYLGLIGEARFGVLAVAWLLLGYFGVFDLGLGRAMLQRISALRDGAAENRAQVFWTALSLNVGLGVIGGLLIWPVAAYFFGDVFKIEDAMRPEVKAVVPWLVLAVPIATLSGVLTGALQGRERFLELNLISVVNSVVFQVVPLLVAKLWAVDLSVLLPVALLTRLFTLILLYDRCRRCVFGGHPISFVRAEASQLLRFGGWVTITSFISPMMVILDRFIIGSMLGAKAVSYYTVPFQLADRTTIIPVALSSAIFPRLAIAARAEEKRISNDSFRIVICVMTPLMAVGIMLMEPFLSWWITEAFAREAGLVGRILLLGYWAYALQTIPYVQLQAKGRPDIVAKCLLVELFPYFLMLYVGLDKFGIVGAAVAFSVRIFVDFVLLGWLSGILKQAIHLLIVPLLLFVIILIGSLKLNVWSYEWLIFAAISISLSVSWAWREAPSELRNLALAQAKLIVKISKN